MKTFANILSIICALQASALTAHYGIAMPADAESYFAFTLFLSVSFAGAAAIYDFLIRVKL